MEVYFEDFFSKCSVILEDKSENEVSMAIHKVYYEVCHNRFDIVANYEERLLNYRKASVVEASVFGGEWHGNATGGMAERLDEGEEGYGDEAPHSEGYSRNGEQQSVHDMFNRAGANSGFFNPTY